MTAASGAGAENETAGAAGRDPADRWKALLRTSAGRLALVGAFTVLLALTNAVAWPAVGALLALLSLMPAQRRPLLAVATLGVAMVAPPLNVDLLAELGAARDAEAWVAAWPVVVLATVAFGGACVGFVRRWPKSPVGRRPVLALLLLLTALLVASGDAGLTGPAWFVVASSAMCLGSYVWFFAYALSAGRLREARPVASQLGYWRPFWGFSNAPMGKGAAYLDRVEASNADALLACQLAGLRLMAWAAAAWLAMDAFGRTLYLPHEAAGSLVRLGWTWLPPEGLPRVAEVLDRQVAGAPFPLATRWASVIAEFVLSVLHMMAWGHGVIATCRMAGFNAAANTVSPLLATSVADFYNRFYFYFKELLATFFFYPTYLSYLRSYPRLRLFVATVAAAGFGNFLFHFYRDADDILRLGFGDALFGYRVYACYTLILGVSIAVSQLRLQGRRRNPPAGVRRVVATVMVVVFYCLLNVLDVRTPHAIADYARLYVGLVVP